MFTQKPSNIRQIKWVYVFNEFVICIQAEMMTGKQILLTVSGISISCIMGGLMELTGIQYNTLKNHKNFF